MLRIWPVLGLVAGPALVSGRILRAGSAVLAGVLLFVGCRLWFRKDPADPAGNCCNSAAYLINCCKSFPLAGLFGQVLGTVLGVWAIQSISQQIRGK